MNKKITTAEIHFIRLEQTDILTNSLDANPNSMNKGANMVGARDYYEDDEY